MSTAFFVVWVLVLVPVAWAVGGFLNAPHIEQHTCHLYDIR